MPSSIRRRTALAGTLVAGTVLLARDGNVLSNLDGGMPPVAQKLREAAGRIR